MTVPVKTPKALANKFGKASDSSNHGLNAIIAGDAKVGKTTLVSTAQDCDEAKDLLIIDSDSGTKSIAHRTDIDTFVPENFDDVRDLGAFLLNSAAHSYKTVAIDTLTVLQHLSLSKAMMTRGVSSVTASPEILDYKKANQYMLETLRIFRDLSIYRGMNVLVICHVFEKTDERTKSTNTLLALRPALREEAALLFDMVWFMGKNIKGLPFIQFTHSPKHPAASRKPPGGANLPSRLDNPTMAKILEIFKTASPE